jgi:phosphoenolpyruvate carboxykinase (ATP)
VVYQVSAASVEWNPPAARLRELTGEMPGSQVTEFGNVAVRTRVAARSARSTFVVDDSTNSADQTITRAEYARLAAEQDAYLAETDVVVIDGYIGSDPAFRTRARLVVESVHAGVAAMQQLFYYPVEAGYDPAAWVPDTTVIVTPRLAAPGYPDDRLIVVDLSESITRVLNSDYLGESKTAGLRLWNEIVYRRGGLALHAGCTVLPVRGQPAAVLIVGLSGTGKTTTTFAAHQGGRPAQDEFIGLMPGGRIYATENGCYAKAAGLSPRDEPALYAAATQPDAYLENVSVAPDGTVDFLDADGPRNGRASWPISHVHPWPGDEIPAAGFLLILNRNETVVPGAARLDRAQAAAYFMLGETTGTSAGGPDEAGRLLRVPGTNPFFPRDPADLGNRMLELLQTRDLQAFVLNTGRVGGTDDATSRKVTVAHSAAIVEGIVTGTIEWVSDVDFGYEIAAAVPGVDDIEILQPWRLYQRQGRQDEYDALVARLKQERRDFLASFAGLDEAIVKAIG